MELVILTVNLEQHLEAYYCAGPVRVTRQPGIFDIIGLERIYMNTHHHVTEEDTRWDQRCCCYWNGTPARVSYCQRWQSGSQGIKPRHIPQRLLWTFNYSLSWKTADPSVLSNCVLYLARSPDFYLITHYVGTTAICCCFVWALSTSAVSHISKELKIHRV